MRKMILLASLAALAAMMLVATPAMAQDRGPDRVTICHKPGTPAEQTKRVPQQAVRGHLGHGDTLGPCDGRVVDRDRDRDRDRFDVFDEVDGVSFEIGDVENESGDVELESNVDVEGNNNNVCVGNQQFANTGNFTNQQGVLQSGGGVFVDDDNHNNWWNHDNHNDWWNHDNHNNWWDDDDDNDRIFFGDAQADDIEFAGPDVTFAPQNETTCDQAVQQAAAASSTWGW
jgi:hypothetical protein